MRHDAIACLLLIVACTAPAQAPSNSAAFGAASAAEANLDLAAARGLYRQAAQSDPDPRQRAEAALLSNDGPTALAAWRAYYGAVAESALLAPAGAVLAQTLPSWRGAESAIDDRRAVGFALADSRLYDEAALLLADPCARQRP